MMEKALLSSERMDWNTPREFLDLVRVFSCIGLDPCSNPNSIVGAATEWSLERGQDGLSASWTGHGLVYCNPPYGRQVKEWSLKIAEEGRKGAEIIVLVPSRTDTNWMQSLLRASDCCLFWKGRIRFLGASASAPFPSVVFYFGSNADRFAKIFNPYGLIVSSLNVSKQQQKQQAYYPAEHTGT